MDLEEDYVEQVLLPRPWSVFNKLRRALLIFPCIYVYLLLPFDAIRGLVQVLYGLKVVHGFKISLTMLNYNH